MSRRGICLLLALLLLGAACSTSNEPTGSAGEPVPSVSAGSTPPATGAPAPSAPPPSPSRSASDATTPAIPAPAGAPIPKPGEYVYAQQGTEMFCSAAACSTPDPLPPQMRASMRYGGRSGQGHALEIAMKIAEGRTVRISSEYSELAMIARSISAEFTESGFTRSGEIEPSPPITLLSFPMRQSASTTQSFRDGDASGTYESRVTGRETINAAGKRVSAWKIVSTLKTSGDGAATIGLTMWVDEATRTFLRLAVTIDVTYEITRYKASFTDTLQSAPQ